jgi:hypothetical protein
VVLAVAVAFLLAIPSTPLFTPHEAPAVKSAVRAPGLPPMYPPGHPMPLQGLNGSVYDEQLGLTFTQNFTSLVYNVTAIEQKDPVSGTGPAYLLNGLSDTGYWYQVGVSWDWAPGQAPGTGFDMIYEVWNTTQGSVFPAGGGGGLLGFSGPVNPGDSVSIQLHFASGQVVMLASDRNTGANASVSYSSEGASSFVGLPGNTANYNGYFSGLMTEWYHASLYTGDEQKVIYNSSSPVSSAWMWIDEFGCTNSNCTTRSSVFFHYTPVPVKYTDPTFLVAFSAGGATEFSDAYAFITGSQSLASLTISYSVDGGGKHGPPILVYYSGGDQKAEPLGSANSTFLLDPGSNWTVSSSLPGSNGQERWKTLGEISGNATGAQVVSLVYCHQYSVNFSAGVEGGGTGYSPPTVSYIEFGETNLTSTGVTVWADAGSLATWPSDLQGSNGAERWATNSTVAVVGAPGNEADTYTHQYYVSIGASPPEGGAVSFLAGWLDSGSYAVLNGTASSGWELAGWTGTYPGNFTSARVPVGGPINESALFYPGLTMSVLGEGSVGYSYTNTSGSVSSGKLTIFAATGTTVDVMAEPSSPFYSFAGWSGGVLGGGEPQRQVQLSAPAQVTASFGYNFATVGISAAALAMAAVGLGSVLLTRKRKFARRIQGRPEMT